MPVTFEEEKAISFGSVAETYDRVRPRPVQSALDWLVPDGCGVAVDLAAGTGLFTRELVGRSARVVAVEPDARMREVLARRSPQVDVREGWGEAMPLPDGSADAVFVSTAWHWLDPARAVPEIARVLRPGGRLGVIWTTRDRDHDWVAELDLLRLPGISDEEGEPRTVEETRAALDRHHTVTLPDGRSSPIWRRRRSGPPGRSRSTTRSRGWRRTAASSPPRPPTGRPGSPAAGKCWSSGPAIRR